MTSLEKQAEEEIEDAYGAKGGAKQRKCSKCKKPTKDHPGPYGENCGVTVDDGEKDNKNKRKYEKDLNETEDDRNKRLRGQLKTLQDQEDVEKKKLENQKLERQVKDLENRLKGKSKQPDRRETIQERRSYDYRQRDERDGRNRYSH